MEGISEQTMGNLNILHIGEKDWFPEENLPEAVDWFFATKEMIAGLVEEWTAVNDASMGELNGVAFRKSKAFKLDALLITCPVAEVEVDALLPFLDPYSVFFLDEGSILEQAADGFAKKLCPRDLPITGAPLDILAFLKKNLFSGQYGDKLKVTEMDILPSFDGTVRYNGFVEVELEGHFGQELTPLFTYRYNLMAGDQLTEIWPEFVKDETIELALEVTMLAKGGISDVVGRTWHHQEELAQPFQLPDGEGIGYYCLTFYAKGNGRLRFGSCHWRQSRSGLGQFILGGQRHVDEKRQEIFTYFHPGDLKPPLNVYFSGYRPAEGFEGYFMMKAMGAPFLLVADPRLEGGCFYSGTDTLEQSIADAIQSALDYLQFSNDQLILSGLSMGAFGGLYYGAWLEPHAVIVGKPFTNLGDVVTNLKLKRPDEFETSIDMLNNVVGRNEEGVQLFNLHFWEKFAEADFSKTKFAIAYMEHDDYDPLAVSRLIDFMSEDGVHIFAKGYEGRHNDNSPAINKWFLNQYAKILSVDFEREEG